MQIAALAFLVVLTCSGCASLSGSRDLYFVCSYDTTWDTALETMKGYSITSQSKENGTIETAWIEMEATERGFGIFSREGFGNRERARLSVSVKRLNDVSSVSVLETRQRWHARGGVTQQATKWWPVDPSEEDEAAVVTRLNDKLKEKGCVSA